MRDWFKLVDLVLRPARPHLDRCLRDRERHLAERREAIQRNAREIQECERRIVALREEVFAANDGFVGARMTDLERTWRRLSRPEPEAGLMDLWARMAPAAWIDHKRWRGNAGSEQLDVAVLLAADVDGVEAAEAAARTLFGGAPILWRLARAADAGAATSDVDCTDSLLASHERAACEALTSSEMQPVILSRGRALEHEVHERATRHLMGRPALARSIGRAAFTDHVLGAAAVVERQPARRSPVAALFSLWTTGYTIGEIGQSAVTLEIPRAT